jgi:hypothetical protein
MRKLLGALVVAATAVAVAHAHALYIVPKGESITVVFSDELAPDANIKEATWKKLAPLKLTAVAADGTGTEVKFTQEKDHLKATVPAGTREVFGVVDYGVAVKAEKPTLTKFCPRAILAEAKPVQREEKTTAAPTGLVIHPEKAAGKVRFRVMLSGKPVAKAKVSLIVPEKTDHEDATTDDEGLTPAFDAVGRYGVTARLSVDKAGDLNGQKYEVITYVATLVVDIK